MFDENLYQETISALHASEDTLSEVMNMTHKTKRRGRLRTTAVLAAVIAILCAHGCAPSDGRVDGAGQIATAELDGERALRKQGRRHGQTEWCQTMQTGIQ